MYRTGNMKLLSMEIQIPAAAGAMIQEATMVAVNEAGYAVAASKAPGLTIAGCAMNFTDNHSGGDGEAKVRIRRGTFVWDNDGSIKETDILKDAYVSDEKTVTITATAEGSSRAGRILAVDGDGVTVEMLNGRADAGTGEAGAVQEGGNE